MFPHLDAPAADRDRPVTVRVPPVVLLIAAGVAQRVLPGSRPRTVAATVAASAVAAVSAALAADAVLRFRRHRTTVDPRHPDAAKALVTDGANSLTRNPMYVAMAGALLAHATARRSLPAVLPVAAFVAAMDRGQIRAEEAALGAYFGPSYEAYRGEVPRWIDRRSVAKALAAFRGDVFA